jgi:hypothetical protein
MGTPHASFDMIYHSTDRNRPRPPPRPNRCVGVFTSCPPWRVSGLGGTGDVRYDGGAHSGRVR